MLCKNKNEIKIIITNNLIKKFENIPPNFFGLLIGLKCEQIYLINGFFQFSSNDLKSISKECLKAKNLLINGYYVFGFYMLNSNRLGQEEIKDFFNKFDFQSNSDSYFLSIPNKILVTIIGKHREENNYYLFDQTLKTVENFPVMIKDDEEKEVFQMKKNFTLVHIQARLTLFFQHSNDQDEKTENIQEAMNDLAGYFLDDSTIFKLPINDENKEKTKPSLYLKDQSFIYLKNYYFHYLKRMKEEKTEENKGNDMKDLEMNEKKICMGDLFKFILCDSTNASLASIPWLRLGIEVLKKPSVGRWSEEQPKPSPVFCHDHVKVMTMESPLPLDVLLLVPNHDLSKSLSVYFVEAIQKQLRLFAYNLIDFNRLSSYYVPRPYHYFLQDHETLLTVIFPEGVEEKQLEEMRKSLHDHFMVPTTTPTFKKLKSIKLNKSNSPYLTDVHLGLPPSKVGGKASLVSGSFEYRHYMQDDFDDDGWGCAYRSLQTIASWLSLQGYTEKSVPTHLQIQKALVEVGDKLPSFLNSKKWIGSTEVSYVLEHLYDVKCKICHVSNGREMPSKTREMIHHFETNGTPIMIGGGVLAHTIIGIDFNEQLGHVAYLVLDPHYKGVEDVKLIQEKGWCGWKSENFWSKNTFYNLCMPIRPTSI